MISAVKSRAVAPPDANRTIVRLSPVSFITLHVSGSDRVGAAVTATQLLCFGDKRLRQYLGRLLWCATATTSTPPWISR